ncbi:MAG: Tab2/Atab2 family RNA-binding protein [Elainellaceae cyanobacterium]
MTIWQVDFYRRPLKDKASNPLWELVICSSDKTFAAYAFCPQPEANAQWLAQQFQDLVQQTQIPERIEIFRPQSLSLVEAAAADLNIPVTPTRRTLALKDYLGDRAQFYKTLPNYTGEAYQPIHLDQPPPIPLDEFLWGDRWRFGALSAGDIQIFLRDKPIPIREVPDDLAPIQLGLPSNIQIPGVIIDGGRASMRLARWLQEACPVAIDYIAGAPDGLILEAGLSDRWIIATADDPTVQQAAQTFQSRLQASQGLHFLLIQPDESGMTYTGFWLLRAVP